MTLNKKRNERNEMFKKINAFSSFLMKLILILSQIMLFIMVMIILTLVISRYIFSYSMPWAEEVTRYLMVWCVLLPIGSLFRRKEHIAMTHFVGLLPKKAYFFLRVFFEIVTIVYFYIVFKFGFDNASMMNMVVSAALGIRMFWPYLAIPVSSLIAIIFIVFNLLEDMNNYFRAG